jgi:acyl-CoA thioesterase-1
MHRIIYQLLPALLMAVLQTGCDEPPAHLPRLAPDAVILAFGDSLTFGTGAGAAESYPAQLARRLQRKVINAGVPGEVSAEGRRRLPGLLDLHRPQLLILCHGGNDLLRKLDPDSMRDNLEAMLAAAHARDIPVLLLGVPRPGLFLLESAPLYPELAAQHALPYDGDIIPAVVSDQAFKSDTIHPNAAGYAQIAQAVEQLLRDSGAIP